LRVSLRGRATDPPTRRAQDFSSTGEQKYYPSNLPPETTLKCWCDDA
jgi:hypothetical protein